MTREQMALELLKGFLQTLDYSGYNVEEHIERCIDASVHTADQLIARLRETDK